jgi:hypothetical protein
MGPGYFPSVICVLLMGFGVAAIVRSLRVDGEPIGGFAIKAMVLVLGSVVAFGFLLPRMGLPVAMVVLVLMAAAASTKFRFEVLPTVMLGALVVFCSVVFVKGLGVPMPLIGSWLQPLIPGAAG